MERGQKAWHEAMEGCQLTFPPRASQAPLGQVFGWPQLSLPLHATLTLETRQRIVIFFRIIAGHGMVKPGTGVAPGAVGGGKGDV
jgi:hypothetical protein